MTLPSLVLMVTLAPFTVLACESFTTCAAVTLPGTTWYLRMAWSCALFSGLRSDSTVPSGSLAKALSVGAKTVNGPLLLRTSTRSAALTAATSVLKLSADAAVSTISFLGPAWAEKATKVNATIVLISFFISVLPFNGDY